MRSTLKCDIIRDIKWGELFHENQNYLYFRK